LHANISGLGSSKEAEVHNYPGAQVSTLNLNLKQAKNESET
jgi:hypothetical protein